MTPTEKQLYLSIGKAIKFWRIINRLKQRDFAELIKTKRSYVAKFENAHVGISHIRIIEIAEALGISPFTILNGMPGDEEIQAILKLYSDIPLKLTKEEMELIFCQKVFGEADPEKFYRHVVKIARGGKF